MNRNGYIAIGLSGAALILAFFGVASDRGWRR